MHKSVVTVPAERIEQLILLIRGNKVILDADLAALYGVNEATDPSSKEKFAAFSRRLHVPA